MGGREEMEKCRRRCFSSSTEEAAQNLQRSRRGLYGVGTYAILEDQLTDMEPIMYRVHTS